MIENKLQMFTISIHYNNGNWDTENMQFHRVPYLGDMLFLIYKGHFIILNWAIPVVYI